MKDLYRRNKLAPRESDRIRIHNSEGSEEDKEAAFTILLNPRKKAEYDRAHATLSHIGYLRRHLGLGGKSGWRIHHSDFLDPPEPPSVRRRKPRRTVTPKAPRRARRLRPMVWLVLVVMAVAPLVYLAWPTAEHPERAVRPSFSRPVFVVLDQAALHVRADRQSAVLAKLDEFQDLAANPEYSGGRWAHVRVNAQLAGYVRSEAIAPGSGDEAQVAKCRLYGSWRPESGQHLGAGKSGNHRFVVVNPPGTDALVKLKDHEGRTQVFFYVRGGETVTLGNVPEGRYQLHYALGENYSPACGRFLDEMQAVMESRFITFGGVGEGGSGPVLTRTLKSGMYKLSSVENRLF